MKFTKYLYYLNPALVAGFSGTYFYLETFGLEERKKKLQLNMNNTPVLLPNKLNHLINQVMDDMNLKKEQRSLIRTVLTGSFNPKHIGYAGGLHGAVIGIPQYFILEEKINFDFSLLVDDVVLPQGKTPAEVFKNSIILSDAAKKFAIAQKIYESGHPHFYVVGLLPSVLAALVTGGRHILHRSERRKYLNGFLTFQLFLLALSFFVLVHDLSSVHREVDSDMRAACLGKSYIEGGIEYFEKSINRNKIIKQLNKNAPFEENGDVVVGNYRTTHMSLFERIKYLKLRLTGSKDNEAPLDYFSMTEMFHKSSES